MESVKNQKHREKIRPVSAPTRAPLGRLVRREPVKHFRASGKEIHPQKATAQKRDLLASLLAGLCFCLSAGYMVTAPRQDVLKSEEEVTQLFHSTVEDLVDSFKSLRVEPSSEIQEEGNGDSQAIEMGEGSARAFYKEEPVHPEEVEAFTSNKRGPKISREALTSKVLRIIRTHSPRNRDPHTLADAIVSESLSQDFDPLFVAAVIKSESTFNSLARSHKGAQGLMQLMPRTGAWLADMARMPRGKLTDPGYNLRLGVAYLKKLQDGYGGDRIFTLIAYNWGPGRVESAADGERRVPPEVMGYAIKIMNDYRRWSSGQ